MQLKQQQIADPARQGRRLFEIVRSARSGASETDQSQNIQLFAMFYPNKSGSHRLIVREAGKITHVIPLVDRNWQRFLSSLTALDETRIKQREAMLFLRKQCRDEVTFRVINGTVFAISLRSKLADRSAIQAISNFDKLSRLELYRCELVNAGDYLPIANQTSISSLDFYDTVVTDETLAQVATLPNLRSLAIQDQSVHKKNRSQTSLVTDKGIAKIAGSTKLKYLSLCGDGITEQALVHISKLANLESLSVNNTKISPVELLDWAAWANIENTRLRNYHPNGNGIDLRFEDGCSRIYLSGNLERKFFQLLPEIMIRELTLPNTTTDADLASVGRMSTLKRLSIQHCENVTDEGITHLGDLPNLEELNLWYSKRIGDRSVATLKKLKSLKKLNIEGTAIGGSAIEELKESLAACEIRAR